MEVNGGGKAVWGYGTGQHLACKGRILRKRTDRLTKKQPRGFDPKSYYGRKLSILTKRNCMKLGNTALNYFTLAAFG